MQKESVGLRSSSGDASPNPSGDSNGSSASRRIACIKRVEQAINHHDLDALAECFDPDYQSEFPAHLGRSFRGHAQLRKNWTGTFAEVPNIRATLVQAVANGESVWTEWDYEGIRTDGAPYHARGVTIQTIPEDRITRVRLYVEVVQDERPGTGAATRGIRSQDS
jgi:hypothetical protein